MTKFLWQMMAGAAVASLLATAGCGTNSGPPGGQSGSSGTGASSSGEGGGVFTSGGGMGGVIDLGGGGSSGGRGSDVCGSVDIDVSVEEVVTPGNVLIIFDQSQSMDEDFNGTPKWRAAADAVAAALAPNQDLLTIGAIFFPTMDSVASVTFFFPCDPASVAPINQPPQIPFMPGPQFLQAWNQRWTAANLVLATPLDMAVVRGAEALGGATLQGQIVVIIVTDGEPTCTATPTSIETAQTWLGLNIPTYVIGLPGAVGVQMLNDLAVAGGTARQGGQNLYLTPADAGALERELNNITSTVIARTLNECVIQINETPPDLEKVFLVVTEASTGQEFQVARGPDGWELAPDGSSATLNGATCDEALGGRFSSVSFQFGCVDIPVLR